MPCSHALGRRSSARATLRTTSSLVLAATATALGGLLRKSFLLTVTQALLVCVAAISLTGCFRHGYLMGSAECSEDRECAQGDCVLKRSP